jgi:hypothetical protein
MGVPDEIEEGAVADAGVLIQDGANANAGVADAEKLLSHAQGGSRMKRKCGELQPAGSPPDKQAKAKAAHAVADPLVPNALQSKRTTSCHVRRSRANAKCCKEAEATAPRPQDPCTYVLPPYVVTNHPGAHVEKIDADAGEVIDIASTAWEAKQLRYLSLLTSTTSW